MNNTIKISGKILPRYDEILSNEALKFIKELHENFNATNSLFSKGHRVIKDLVKILK